MWEVCCDLKRASWMVLAKMEQVFLVICDSDFGSRRDLRFR